MNKSRNNNQRTIGLDMHPDVFTAAALQGAFADSAQLLWVKDRLAVNNLVSWAAKELNANDIIVLEASANSFEVVRRLAALGLQVHVLESAQAGKLRENYCNDDKSSAVKLARCYLTGMAKKVWQPDEQTRIRRELYFAYERAVKNSTRCRNQIRGFLNQHCIRCPKGLSLTKPEGLKFALQAKDWSPLQVVVIKDLFDSLIHNETQRKTLSKHMCIEVYNDKQLKQLMRLMGVAHVIAFAVGAFVGDIERFATAKKLVGYFGLAPRKTQSGNNIQGRKGGIGNGGRKQVRALLIQSAQNALRHQNNPLHKWGWKLVFKKDKNMAAAAVARKIATAIWHVLKGHCTPLKEANHSLMNKLKKISVEIGSEYRKQAGFNNLTLFCEHFFERIKENS